MKTLYTLETVKMLAENPSEYLKDRRFAKQVFKPPEFIKKCPPNPILHRGMIPYPTVQTYNAGITKYNGKYVMIFRNDYGRDKEDFDSFKTKINLGLATSDDGLHWFTSISIYSENFYPTECIKV